MLSRSSGAPSQLPLSGSSPHEAPSTAAASETDLLRALLARAVRDHRSRSRHATVLAQEHADLMAQADQVQLVLVLAYYNG